MSNYVCRLVSMLSLLLLITVTLVYLCRACEYVCGGDCVRGCFADASLRHGVLPSVRGSLSSGARESCTQTVYSTFKMRGTGLWARGRCVVAYAVVVCAVSAFARVIMFIGSAVVTHGVRHVCVHAFCYQYLCGGGIH